MKVLHINRNYITSALHQVMMGHLNSTEIDNIVFAPTDNKKAAVITPENNVIVSECFNRWDRFFFNYKQAKIRKSLLNTCDVSVFDCIHAYTLFTDGNCAMNISEKYKIPFIVAVRNADVNDFLKKLPHLRKRGIEIMNRASAILFLSKAYLNQVFDKYVPERLKEELLKKTHIIPNGIDDFWLENTVQSIDMMHFRRISRNELRLLYVGRIDKNKNVPTILKTIEILKKDGWNANLTVVGKIEDKFEYRKFAFSPYVTYIPAQPKEKLIHIYRNNDIFVMPSFTESFGLVYAEAMSQGLPVIYTRGQGFDGQFPEGEVGYPVNADSAQSIADAIKLIVEKYNVISNTVTKNVTKFTWTNIVNKYATIYKDIVEKR
jgi:glycosyltransferase involved in cell wall biosynthesis